MNPPGHEPRLKCAFSGSWMRFGMCGANVILSHVRVDLGCPEVGVTEHRLHRTKVGSAAQQVRCERVSELMRGGERNDSRRYGVAPDHLPEGGPRVATAASRGKQGNIARTGHPWPDVAQVTTNAIERYLAYWNDPAFSPLATNRDEATLQVDVSQAQLAKLAHAQSRSIHEMEHGPVQRAAVG
jgi:hypothetical protein